MKTSGIYAIRNITNGKRYVGSAVYLTGRFCDHRKRLRLGKHHSIKLQRAWDKYGEQNFSFEVLQLVARESLLDAEQNWLDYFQAASPRLGYNVSPTAGNCLGVKHSAETVRRVRAAILRRAPQSQETIDKRVAKLRGQKRTPELRALLSRQKLGNTINVGRKHTDEARANMSAARLGIRYSDETIARMSSAHIGAKQSAETKAKRSASLRAAWARRKGAVIGPAIATA